MGSLKESNIVVSLLFLVLLATSISAAVDCGTVAALLTACSTFISLGTPDPYPGSPCCDGMMGLQVIADTNTENRQSVCTCLMGLITTFNPNATMIATVPGLCGISLGFNISPTTDCNFIL